VTANVTLKSDTDSEIVDLKSDAPEAHPFDSFKISITAVAPSKVAASEPDPESYQMTFEVEKL
jgi:hypothetical protein